MATPCNKHPGYSGLRLGKKAVECPTCVAYYHARKAEGDKETRKRGKNKPKDGVKVGAPEEGLVATKEDIEAALAATRDENDVVEELVSETNEDDAQNTELCDGGECSGCENCAAPEDSVEADDDVSLEDIQDLL